MIEYLTLHCPVYNKERRFLSHPNNMELRSWRNKHGYIGYIIFQCLQTCKPTINSTTI